MSHDASLYFTKSFTDYNSNGKMRQSLKITNKTNLATKYFYDNIVYTIHDTLKKNT